MRGDIFWAQLVSDGTGHEQRGRRPFIVVGDEDSVPLVTLIPLTSRRSSRRFPHTYEINRTNLNGLPEDSVALVFQVTSLDRRRLGNLIGKLEQTHYINICTILDEYFRA